MKLSSSLFIDRLLRVGIVYLRRSSLQRRICARFCDFQSLLGPGGPGDQNHDFLLSFKIARSIPADATWPESQVSANCADANIKLPFGDNTVGPGCSNSNYP